MVSCGHHGTGCCGVWPAGQLEAEVDEGLTRSPLESRPPNAGWTLWWVSLPLTFLVCVSFYSDKLRLCTAVMKWHLVLVIHGTHKYTHIMLLTLLVFGLCWGHHENRLCPSGEMPYSGVCLSVIWYDMIEEFNVCISVCPQFFKMLLVWYCNTMFSYVDCLSVPHG